MHIYNNIFLFRIAPIGVSFLIAGRMLEIDNFSNIISHLGFYILTVFIGLILQGFVILPFLHWIVTRKSPYKIIFKLGPAFATAIGTSSRYNKKKTSMYQSSTKLCILIKRIIQHRHGSLHNKMFRRSRHKF